MRRVDGRREVWVADAGGVPDDGRGVGHAVVVVDADDGSYVRTLGTPGVPGRGLDPVQFGSVTDVAFDGRRIYVTDGEEIGNPERPPLNNRLLVFSDDDASVATGPTLERVVGTRTAGNGSSQFFIPHSVVVDACGRVWVSDRNNSRVQIFDADGAYVDTFACFRGPPTCLARFGATAAGLPRWVATVGRRLVVVPFREDCDAAPRDVGTCAIEYDQTLNFDDETPAQLHSLATGRGGADVYVVTIEDPRLPPKLAVAKYAAAPVAAPEHQSASTRGPPVSAS